ncbi:unnamed protein product [Cunninghamella blakesleeana]
MNYSFFPNEILHIIFSYLSQKYRARCGLVCKNWKQVTRSSKFYKTIYIYTLRQYTHFFNTATQVKLSNNQLIKYHVQQLIFECWEEKSIEEGEEEETTEIEKNRNNDIGKGIINGQIFITNPYFIEQLNQLFPNINYINYVPLSDTIPILPTYLPHLKEMKLWCSKRIKDWTKRDHQFLNGLELDMLSALQKNMIQLHIERLNHHVGISFRKIVSFSINIQHIKDLYLDFENVIEHEWDERTLENIHLSCPKLTSLTLKYFDMELSNQFICSSNNKNGNNITSPSSQASLLQSSYIIKPCTSLQLLELKDCYLRHPHCFYYLSLKYPNLVSLSLHVSYFYHINDSRYGNNGDADGSQTIESERGDEEEEEFDDDDEIENEEEEEEVELDEDDEYHTKLYRAPLMNLIISCHRLKNLRLFIDIYGERMIIDWNHCCWPNQELLQWFILNPTTLKSLDYPFDLNTMEYNQDDNDNMNINTNMNCLEEIKKRTAFLDHLTSLTLRRMESSTTVLNYLLRKRKRTIASLTITSLTLHGGSKIPTPFLFYDWLVAFPNLKVLHLSYMELTNHIANDDHDHKDNNNNTKHKNRYYALQELNLEDVKLYLNDGISGVLYHCPYLNTLLLDNIELLHSPSTTSDNMIHYQFDLDKYPELKENYIFINGSHLVLDKLYISDIYYFGSHFHRTIEYSPAPLTLLVKELGTNRVSKLKKDRINLTNDIIFICQSVDVVKFSSH